MIVLKHSLKLIKTAEGFSNSWYKCSEGVDTIGYGFTKEILEHYYLDMPQTITRGEADIIITNYTRNIIKRIENKEYYQNCDTIARKAVIVDMAYNLGLFGFERFKQCIKALEIKRFDLAAEQMQNSKWYKQVKTRGERNVKIMKNGSSPLINEEQK